MRCEYCNWDGPASVEDDELARCPRCGEDTIKSKPKVWPCGHTEDEHCFADTMFCVRDKNWFKEVQNENSNH